jgi:hypothetical protein
VTEERGITMADTEAAARALYERERVIPGDINVTLWPQLTDEIKDIWRKKVRPAAAGADPQLTEIVGKYRALCTAMQRFDQLRREVAALYVGLSEDQKRTYGEVVERIEIEDREAGQ